MRKILVTAALPYANGDIHLGHLVEYLQTDYWVRFQHMRGHECIYICADDTHGTPVMISARQRGITPEQLIAEKHVDHLADFKGFEVGFDNYYSTDSQENRLLAEEVFRNMQAGGHIESRPVKQFFCPHDNMFLPDRFVRGTCPRCGASDQYGDSCDKCSATYASSELQNPHCTVCGATPIAKESEHLFFKLNHFRDFLRPWVKEHTAPEVARKLEEWLKEDLRDWDISRDAPYFGFEIPGYPGKFFYVWLDAPLGYISSTIDWCRRQSRDADEFWKRDGNELYHFIGKDVVYFHTLFWPAMLKTAGYKTPDQVFVHGFLTVKGEKMSKSKGTFITARTYLDHLDPLYLRYYYACKMSATLDDLDLNFNDFINRVNAELIGKITNLASRSVQMLNKMDNRLGRLSASGEKMLAEFRKKAPLLADHYQNRDFAKVMLEVRGMADQANRYLDEQEPWKTREAEPEKTRVVLTDIVNLFRCLVIFLKPVLPSYAVKVETLLKEPPYQWDSLDQTISERPIGLFSHLLKRIEAEKIEKILGASREQTGKET